MFKLHTPSCLLCCLLASCASSEEDTPEANPPAQADIQPTMLADDVRFIRQNRREGREMTCGTCAASHRQKMYELGGKRLIAACEVILANPEDPREIADAFWMLGQAKGDRKRFVRSAVAALAKADRDVRWSAAELLGEIGSPEEGPALVAALADKSADVASSAAKSLSVIGGPDELVALNAWLRGTGPDKCGTVERGPIFREDVTKYRDEMAARLATKGKR